MPQIVRNIRHRERFAWSPPARTTARPGSGAARLRDTQRAIRAFAASLAHQDQDAPSADDIRVRMAQATESHRAMRDAITAAATSSSATSGFVRDNDGKRLHPMTTADLARLHAEHYGRPA